MRAYVCVHFVCVCLCDALCVKCESVRVCVHLCAVCELCVRFVRVCVCICV